MRHKAVEALSYLAADRRNQSVIGDDRELMHGLVQLLHSKVWMCNALLGFGAERAVALPTSCVHTGCSTLRNKSEMEKITSRTLLPCNRCAPRFPPYYESPWTLVQKVCLPNDRFAAQDTQRACEHVCQALRNLAFQRSNGATLATLNATAPLVQVCATAELR